MTANELRIGNLVEEPKGYTHRIETISENSKRKRYPIPLTEEWLVKFGFYWDSKKVYLCKNVDAYRIRYVRSEVHLFQRSQLVIIPHMKHVHQLQNLYHALTGEELTIKE